jgi:hypothetical protein
LVRIKHTRALEAIVEGADTSFLGASDERAVLLLYLVDNRPDSQKAAETPGLHDLVPPLSLANPKSGTPPGRELIT